MFLIRLLKVIFTKNFWTYPKKKKNLIIDIAGSEELFMSNILEKNETLVIDLHDYNWANIFILVNAFLKWPKLLKQDKFCFIFLSYIDLIKAKNVITWMDYIISFYRLKNYNKSPKYISIQTGRRSIEPGQFFDSLNRLADKSLSCDYIFCFGEAHKREYERYIKCTAIPSGSVRNNIVPIKSKKPLKEILFISQFRKNSGNVFIKYFEEISHERFYLAEKLLFDRLVPYCIKNNLRLNVLSAIKFSESEEKNFYNQLTKGFEINFLSHESFDSGYNYVDSYEYIVGINSTLAYEALGRGKKVVFFDARNEICGIPFDLFGWPLNLTSRGDFWSNKINDSEFNRLMDFLITTPNDEWSAKFFDIKTELMQYDFSNPFLREVV